MIERLNHVAIVVPDLQVARERYRDALGAKVSEAQDYPEHGVRVVFIELANTKIELMSPLGKDSPIQKFLDKNPKGGLHHLCLSVGDVTQALQPITEEGLRVLGGDKAVKKGAHGHNVAFLHPQDFCGVLLELEQGTY
ncbi:MAG: methylmalonyl-CoA epimerase [Alphaproteobacteria bacterium GM202ARS2]|nr:methylmalonyl-CoA epimerase [Alphaproteobacteria bacterium GM202ARS2]